MWNLHEAFCSVGLTTLIRSSFREVLIPSSAFGSAFQYCASVVPLTRTSFLAHLGLNSASYIVKIL